MTVEGVGWRPASVVMMAVMLSVVAGQDSLLYPSDVPISMGETLTTSTGELKVEDVTHTTPLGTVLGVKERTKGINPTNTYYYAFRGIPFAEPPVGGLRWADPVDLLGTWPGGHLNATTYRSFCPQYNTQSGRVLGSEDCLFLNVFTPNLPGAYIRGSSNAFGPSRLMAHDIVLVTINYRLGALGYLTTEDETLAGNYGTLDQVSALRWVQANIVHFGGDPSRVTIGGFSAGSASVHLHMLSPLSQGLFHGCIMMSGSSSSSWGLQEHRKSTAVQLGQKLSCPSSPSAALKSCLIGVSTNDLIIAQAAMNRYEFWPFQFCPVIDAGLRKSALLPGPFDSLKPSKVPVLLGSVPDEGLLFAGFVIIMSKMPENITSVYREAVPYVLQIPREDYPKAMTDAVERFYFTQHIKLSYNDFIETLTEVLSDGYMTSCIKKTTESFASAGLPVYKYIYTHRDPDTPVWAAPVYKKLKQLGVTSTILTEGVSHGDDLCLLFNIPQAQGKLSQRDQKVSDLLTSMWSSFVTTGTPLTSKDASFKLPPWTPVQPGEPINYYKISFTPSMVYTPYKNKEMNFWNQLLPSLNQHPTCLHTHITEEMSDKNSCNIPDNV
ncbi:Esterase E4-like2 [Homarus americanus]|uniref:Carboxylic ester hydrolase n=1 Tax=Homarus americanus TaxID=6706 RepID=A0A8J5TBT8_HOMAM|nr:Esterase E4-like2 [Homarus americanus]